MKKLDSIAILGAGNIGQCIAEGIRSSGLTERIILTNSNPEIITELRDKGFQVMSNVEAVKNSKILITAVQPRHLDALMKEIVPEISADHTIISIISGASCERLRILSEDKTEKIVRVMANTAIQVRESMTLITSENKEALEQAERIFSPLGKTMIFPEKLMTEATVLSGSAVAIAFELIRLLQQAGIQNGISEKESLEIATQVMKGAAMLLQQTQANPSDEIEKVTTPGGCTRAALDELEAQGLSQVFLNGIGAGIDKAKILY